MAEAPSIWGAFVTSAHFVGVMVAVAVPPALALGAIGAAWAFFERRRK